MKKKILYALLILLIIAFIYVIIIAINHNTKNINNNVANEITEDRLKELFDNSYKYYLLYKGIDKNSSSNIKIDDITYYKVKSFKSFEEIETMINNTFVKGKQEHYYNNLFENRNYIETENGVYVEYKENCNNIEISYDNIMVTKIDENTIFIDCQNTGVNAYYEDGNWYLSSTLHFCKDENKESNQ